MKLRKFHSKKTTGKKPRQKNSLEKITWPGSETLLFIIRSEHYQMFLSTAVVNSASDNLATG